MHCNVLLPFPDQIDSFCAVSRGMNDPPFFSKAPSGVNPASVFLHHRFVYKKFDPAKVGISTIKPVDNALVIWAEPTQEGDLGPFKNNVKLFEGLSLELNKAYAGTACKGDDSHKFINRSMANALRRVEPRLSAISPNGFPFHRLPACMQLVVNNVG
jgi:hypothetical protein